MREWIIANREFIAGLSDIGTMLSLLATAAALVFAAWQIRDSIRTNRAKTIYEVQRDARETSSRLFSDDVVRVGIFGGEAGDEAKVAAAWGQIFNFYAAIFQQRRLGILDGSLWEPFEQELKSFMGLPEARARWERVRSHHQRDYAALINGFATGFSEPSPPSTAPPGAGGPTQA